MKISLNVIRDSNDENNFPHKLLLPNTQVSKLRKAFTNSSSVNIKLSKTQLHKTEQLGGFLDRLLGPSLKTGFHLIGNLLCPLARSVLIPLGLIAAASAPDAALHKKMFGSSTRLSDLASCTILMISNEKINDRMKIIKSLEASGLLIKGISQTIK